MSENPNAASLALDALEENLRKVLLHTGSALTSASQNAGAKLDHTRLHVEKVLPEFLKQWHAALNELEGELINAKAALHRDLAASQKQESHELASQGDLGPDTVMVEASSAEQTNDVSVEMPKGEPSAATDKDETVAQSMDETTVDSAGNPQSVRSADADGQSSEQVSNLQHTITSTSNLSQDKQTPSNGFDLDLGPSPQVIKSTTDSPMPSIEQAQVTELDDPGTSLSNADVGSLLPGLMDYALAGNSTDGTNLGGFNPDVFANPSTLSQPDPKPNNQEATALDIFGNPSGVGDNPFPDDFMQDTNMNFDSNFDFAEFTTQDSGTGQEGEGGAGGVGFDDLFEADFFTLPGGNDDINNNNPNLDQNAS